MSQGKNIQVSCDTSVTQSIDKRAARRLGIDSGEMHLRQHRPFLSPCVSRNCSSCQAAQNVPSGGEDKPDLAKD